MSDYNQFNFTIKEKDLLRVLKDAAAHGYQPLVLINGMYYNLDLELSSAASANLPEEVF